MPQKKTKYTHNFQSKNSLLYFESGRKLRRTASAKEQ